MAPFRSWEDLPSELLCCIGDPLELKWYASARGACTVWRRALAPPSPALLVVADGNMWRPYAAPLSTRRPFELTATLSGVRCVGSSNGWLALSVERPTGRTVFVLLNPIAAIEIVLPPLTQGSRWVSKVVFTPNPTKEDFAAAAICYINRIAYVTAGARRWAITDPICLAGDDQLIDVLYTDNGKVYCLTKFGDVHLLRLPERRRRESANADSSEPEFSVLQPLSPPAKVQGPSELALPYLPPHSWHAEVLALGNLMIQQGSTILPRCANSRLLGCYPTRKYSYITESQGPHLNAPATVEPLLSEAMLPFNPANVFAPPYDTVSAFTGANNLVLCEGSLYQVWRNASCTVILSLPGGGKRRVLENEIIVLRYDPQHQPCWDVVHELGGYSFFIGRNNAVSMYADGVPGLKGNCVYWIGGSGRDQGMAFDLATGRSVSCQAPQVALVARQQHIICWYFLIDVVSNRSSVGEKS